MAEIHPTAIVDDDVELGEEVVIGPGCHLAGRIRLAARTRLMGHVYLQGPLTLGEDNTIYPFVCLGFAPQARGFDPWQEGAGTVLGARNVLREGVTIHRAAGDRATTLGDENYLMAGSHLGHDVRMASRCTVGNNVLLAGHVQVGDQVVFGGGAGVQQFCRVGRLAMLGGNAGVAQDLPPFCLVRTTREVAGLNLVGMRRAGEREHIPALQSALAILYRRGHSNSAAADRIERELADDPLCLELAAFVRSASRGLTGLSVTEPRVNIDPLRRA